MTVVEFGSLFHFIRNGMNVRQDKSGDGLPITRIETIADSTVDPSRVGYAGLVEQSCANWLMKPGDILFSHINSVEHIGKCAIYQGIPEGLVHGMNLLCLRCDSAKLIPGFAKHLIRSPPFRSELSSFVNRAVNQASVSIGNLKKIPVCLPSLVDQNRISTVLDHVELVIANRRAAVVKLGELTQSIFLDMFGDPAVNPSGWPLVTVGEILQSANYGTSEKAGSGGEFPVLRMNNLTRSGEIDLSDLKYMNLSVSKRDRYLVRRGDVLFNRTNSAELVGKTAIYRLEEEVAYAGYLVRLRTNDLADPEYLAAFLNTRRSKAVLRGMCKSIIGMANINAKQVQAMTIPLAPLDLQEQFARRVEAIERLKVNHRAHLAELDALFASLQDRAFRGEL